MFYIARHERRVKTRPRALAAYEADFVVPRPGRAAARSRPSSLKLEDSPRRSKAWGDRAEEIGSRLVVLLTHLLKWVYEPEGGRHRWRASIGVARLEIAKELEDGPRSLRHYPGQELDDQIAIARLKVYGQDGLPLTTFPETCPFTIEQVLDPDSGRTRRNRDPRDWSSRPVSGRTSRPTSSCSISTTATAAGSGCKAKAASISSSTCRGNRDPRRRWSLP